MPLTSGAYTYWRMLCFRLEIGGKMIRSTQFKWTRVIFPANHNNIQKSSFLTNLFDRGDGACWTAMPSPRNKKLLSEVFSSIVRCLWPRSIICLVWSTHLREVPSSCSKGCVIIQQRSARPVFLRLIVVLRLESSTGWDQKCYITVYFSTIISLSSSQVKFLFFHITNSRKTAAKVTHPTTVYCANMWF